jgi:hypothetical protein
MPLAEQYQNNSQTTLAEDLDNSETVITVTDGSVFPSAGQFRVLVDSEIFLVTSRSGNDLTAATRPQEGTTAATHNNGAAITHVLTAASLARVIEQRAGQVVDLAAEAMNFPSREGADDTQPEWWEEADANATLTEVDTAGETLTETFGRALKVVVATSNSYAYQPYTYADQPRIKSGRSATVAYAVWSVSSAVARLRLQSSAGSLGVSADTTAAAWTILTVDPVTLNGTNVQIRLEVDVGTAYFVPLTARPRGLIYKAITTATVKTLTGIADEATWTDVDCTSVTSNLAVMANLHALLNEAVSGFDLSVRCNGTNKSSNILTSADAGVIYTRAAEVILLDDQQIFEYHLDRFTGSSGVDLGVIEVLGFWEWE